jgi:hypothetical protein
MAVLYSVAKNRRPSTDRTQSQPNAYKPAA